MVKLSYGMYILYHLSGTLVLISMISGLTLFPWVFNRIIVPEIERKVGQKLGYHMIQYDMMAHGRYLMRQTEISFYIFLKCLIKWYGKDPNAVKINPKGYALQIVNYPYELFTRKEILWSFAVMVNYLLFVICGGSLVWIVDYYNLY